MLYLQAGTVVLLLALGTIEVILLNPHMNKVQMGRCLACGRGTSSRSSSTLGLREKSEIRGLNDPTYPHAPAAQGILTPIWQGGVALLGLLVLVLGFIAKPVSDKVKVA